MKTLLKTLVLSSFLAATSLAVSAKGSAAKGAEKVAACAACHGAGGAKPLPDHPVLAGQHYDYLVAALSQYKAGKRTNAIMKGFAAALKPEDIQDIAAYYASQEPALKMKY